MTRSGKQLEVLKAKTGKVCLQLLFLAKAKSKEWETQNKRCYACKIAQPTSVQQDKWQLFISWMWNPPAESWQWLSIRLWVACVTELHSSLCLSPRGCCFTTSSTQQYTLILYPFSYSQKSITELEIRTLGYTSAPSMDTTHYTLWLQWSASPFWLYAILKVPLNNFKEQLHNSKAPVTVIVTVLALFLNHFHWIKRAICCCYSSDFSPYFLAYINSNVWGTKYTLEQQLLAQRRNLDL